VISHKHRFIFVHAFRTGGASVENHLYTLHRKCVYREPIRGLIRSDFRGKVAVDVSDLGCEIKWLFEWGERSHVTARHFRQFLLDREYGHLWDSYYKFAFVRNPWDRLVSLYAHYHPDGRMESFDAWLRRIMDVEDPFTTTEANGCVLYDSLTNLDWISDENGNVLLDFVGRFEDLQRDFDHICDTLGIARRRLPHTNRSRHAPYWEYYDEETKAIVADRHQKDIETFGYRFAEGRARSSRLGRFPHWRT
jgi:hypothetical protein